MKLESRAIHLHRIWGRMIPKVIRYHIGASPYGYCNHLVEDTIHVVYYSNALSELSTILKTALKMDKK